MDKIKEEFEKKIKHWTDSNLKIFTAGYKSRDEEIKELRGAFEEAKIQANNYAKRLVNLGEGNVVWYATEFPKALKESE